MSKSLAELRQSPRVGMPERSYSLCLAPGLVSEVQMLLGDLEDAVAESSDEGASRPKRMADSGRVKGIQQRLAAISEEMKEHTGSLTLRAVEGGQWRRWVDEHPAREGVARDAKVAYGACNADDLMDDLGAYAVAWNGEPLADGDWAWIESNASNGDLMEIVSLVVKMHETVVDVPKLLRRSQVTHFDANG